MPRRQGAWQTGRWLVYGVLNGRFALYAKAQMADGNGKSRTSCETKMESWSETQVLHLQG